MVLALRAFELFDQDEGWQQLHRLPTSIGNMTVTETVKETVKGALATSDEPRESFPVLNLRRFLRRSQSMDSGEALRINAN